MINRCNPLICVIKFKKKTVNRSNPLICVIKFKIMSKNLKIGLFGFGVVGQGLLDLHQRQNLKLDIHNTAKQQPRKKPNLKKKII